jgi:hypothetical protein
MFFFDVVYGILRRMWTQAKETQLDKMRKQGDTLRHQQAVVGDKVRQQADIGGLLHAIDLQQLEIENAQHLELITEKSRELLGLKVKVASATKVLNTTKKTIAEKEAEFKQVSAEIATRQNLLDKVRVIVGKH